jgi:hypothetical protein
MRKQQQGQQQRLPGHKVAHAGAAATRPAAAGGDAKSAAAAAAAAAALAVPDTLGAGGLKVPQSYHDAALSAAAHAGATLLQLLSPQTLHTWMRDKVRQCRDAGLGGDWKQLLSDLIFEQIEDMLKQPVDTHKLPDYTQEVAHPMCFDWIKQALQSGKYKMEFQQQQGQQQQQQRPPLRVYSWQSLYAFGHDLQLIVSNARLYNGKRPQNRAVLEAANALQKKLVSWWSKVQAHISSKLKQRLEAHKQQQQ